MKLVRYADRPDLEERRDLASQVFPAFLLHNVPGPRSWPRLYSDFPDFQLALLDGDAIVAEAHAVPIPWDGTIEGLPSGWDEAFELGMTTALAPAALSMLVISVHPERQGERLGGRMLEAAREAAAAAGLGAVLAPVRPTSRPRSPTGRSGRAWRSRGTATTWCRGCSTCSWCAAAAAATSSPTCGFATRCRSSS